MATLAAIRAASTSSLHSPHPLLRNDSQIKDRAPIRNGVQISSGVAASARPSVVAPICCPTTSPTTARTTPTAGLAASCSYVPFRSSSKQFKEVGGRRRDAARRASGASASPRCESDGNNPDEGKTPFGYTRKDVILIGFGLLGAGFALKYGLELFGVDSIKAGNAVQLIMVLGLTVGWISTYVFRVSSKEMTYAKQLKDYENKVMEKRLEEMPEAELESMLAQIEEDKRILRESRDRML